MKTASNSFTYRPHTRFGRRVPWHVLHQFLRFHAHVECRALVAYYPALLWNRDASLRTGVGNPWVDRGLPTARTLMACAAYAAARDMGVIYAGGRIPFPTLEVRLASHQHHLLSKSASESAWRK